MKKIEQIFCIMFLLLTIIVTADNILANDSEISVKIDNEKINFDEESGMPFAEDERTLVPLRRAMENLVDTIEWNQEYKQAIFTKDETVVVVPLETNFIYVNNQIVDIYKPATVINERTYLPIRFLAEAFGCEVEWLQDSKTVFIKTENYIEDEKVALGINEEDSNATVRYIEPYLNVRNEMKIDKSNIIGQLNTGDRVTIVNEFDEWYEIKYFQDILHQTAYVFKQYLRKDSDSAEITGMITINDVDKNVSGEWLYDRLIGTDQWNQDIYEVANEYGIDPVLVKLIMAVESGGNLKDINPCGPCIGLMQVNQGNINWSALVHNDFELMLEDGRYAIEAGCDMIVAHGSDDSVYSTMLGYGGFYKRTDSDKTNKFYETYEYLSNRSRYDSKYLNK